MIKEDIVTKVNVIERATLMIKVIELGEKGLASHSEVETLKKVVGAAKEIKVDKTDGLVRAKMGANTYTVTYKNFAELVEKSLESAVQLDERIVDEKYIKEMH